MKLNAISVSGQRSKDFVDIYFVLDSNKYSLADMVKFYQIKYSQQSDMHVLKSLMYFDDIDLSDWPVLLKNRPLQWADVRIRIEKEVMLLVRSRK
jgi:hypothetical protein